MAFVHHTENPNGYVPAEVPAMLLAIYVFHRYVRGWDDIGYNFVVDLFGRIYEARAGGIDEPVVGAQAGGYNEVSTGIAVLGSFSSVPISAPAPSARTASGLEACSARGTGARQGYGARRSGRRGLQPLSGRVPRIAPPHRRPP
jgi:hypothetical protein